MNELKGKQVEQGSHYCWVLCQTEPLQQQVILSTLSRGTRARGWLELLAYMNK